MCVGFTEMVLKHGEIDRTSKELCTRQCSPAWWLSLGNLRLCEAENYIWRATRTNYPGEMKLDLNKKNYNRGHRAQNIGANLWFFSSIPSSPVLVAGGWERCRVRERGGKNCLISPAQCAGVQARGWLQTWHMVAALAPGRCLARVPCPMGLQDLGHLAVGWWFVILHGGGGAGSRAGFRDRLFFPGKWWELFCTHFSRFTAGPQRLAPPGVPRLSLLSWPKLWFFFSFCLLS